MNESTNELDFTSLTMIEDVKREAVRLAFHEYRAWTISILIVGLFFIYLFPPVVVVIFVWAGYIYSKAHKSFMQQFARCANMTYTDSIEMHEVKGRLFDLGHSNRISNVISGMYEGHAVRLFNYTYTIGSGKHKTTYHFTVHEVSFDKTQFPYILLQSRTMSKYAWIDMTGNKDIEIKLEEEFKDAFRLFAKENYEIEILEIFTPEVLHFLKDDAPQYSIEFAENRLYVYDNTFVSTKSALVRMHDVVKRIVSSLGPRLERMHDDFSALHEYYGDDRKMS